MRVIKNLTFGIILFSGEGKIDICLVNFLMRERDKIILVYLYFIMYVCHKVRVF